LIRERFNFYTFTLQLGRCRYFRSVSVFGIFRYF